MIWLVWRQFRTQALVVAGLLIVLAIALAISGTHLLHIYDTTVATCAQHNDCVSARARFQAQAKWHNALNLLVLAAPALLGAFWGAPLVARELESRTSVLAWTQSVSRSRWFLVKVAVTGAAGAIATGLLSLMVTSSRRFIAAAVNAGTRPSGGSTTCEVWSVVIGTLYQ